MTKRLKKEEKWTYWRDQNDTLFSRLVKVKYNWHCVETGANDNLQTAHIIPRDYMNVRWDFDNAICLKSGRHKHYTHHPIEWKHFINSILGDGYYEKMEQKAVITKKWTVDELKQLYEDLKANPLNRGK